MVLILKSVLEQKEGENTMERNEKTCVVGYRTGVTEDGTIYGKKFSSRLGLCCDEFSRWFYNTGNHKNVDWNELGLNFKNGLNLIFRHYSESIFISLSVNNEVNEIHFCPFCGAKIEFKEIDRVKLIPNGKFVPAGFIEKKIE